MEPYDAYDLWLEQQIREDELEYLPSVEDLIVMQEEQA